MRIGLAKTVAWIVLALVIVATLGPPPLRPHSFLPRDVEHFAAFAALGAIVAFAYPARRWRSLVIGACFAVLLEVAQLWAPGRHAYASDAAIGIAGLFAGGALASLLEIAWRFVAHRAKRRRPDAGKPLLPDADRPGGPDREAVAMDRRRRTMLLAGAGAAGAGLSVAAAAAARAAPRRADQPPSAFGIDVAEFGVRAGSPDDQSAALQRAIDRAAAAGAPLAFAPGVYRAGGLTLPSGAHLVAARGACKLALAGARPLLLARNAERITLSGLVIDGLGQPLPERQGLIQFETVASLKISDCAFVNAGRHGLMLFAVAGEVVDNAIPDAADAALMSLNARGLLIARNAVARAGNNGILVFRDAPGDDGTLVSDNRIEQVSNRSGGDGPYGNGINVFRAANVIVSGNRMRGCALSGVRGNSASNIAIQGNVISDAGETAIYSEFGFQGAAIANNIVDGAQTGVSVTNFNEGGRLAVVAGNVIRNLSRREANPSPDFNGVGIHVEADAAVTGNVVERASAAGLVIGWGRYLRDVAATGNVVRDCGFGIGASVADGAGGTLVANNVISGCPRGAVVGLEFAQIVTGDLTREGATRFPRLAVASNLVS